MISVAMRAGQARGLGVLIRNTDVAVDVCVSNADPFAVSSFDTVKTSSKQLRVVDDVLLVDSDLDVYGELVDATMTNDGRVVVELRVEVA